VSGENNGDSSVTMLGTTVSSLTSQYPDFSTEENGLNDTSNALNIPDLEPSLEDIPVLARK
jgi:hypothetical protein